MIVLALIPSSGPRAGTDSPEVAISIRSPDPPSAEVLSEMIRWKRLYKKELAPVREQWSRVVRTIREGRISELPLVCPDFRDRLERLDRQQLYAVVDPVVRTWLGRGLVLLDGAAGQCRSNRVFDLGFRLYKARLVIQALDRRLEKYP